MAGENGWKPLGSVAKVRSGYAFKSSDMGDVGEPVIKIKNINPPRVDTSDCQRVPREIIERVSNYERYELAEGDILIAMTGATVGKVGRLPASREIHYLNQRVGKVYLADEAAADYDYIYYVLSQDTYVRQMFGVADGSAQANISGSQIEKLQVPLPPLSEQKAIAEILGSLDAKIELNRRMNETLESLARALFKSWFVDFDPVRAKLDSGTGVPPVKGPLQNQGRDAPATPPGLPPATAALFPDSFDSSTGIPSGWHSTPLSDLTADNSPITYGVVKPGPHDENGVRFVRGGDVACGRIAVEDLRTITQEVSDQYKRTLLRGGEILVSLVGNPGEVAVVPPCLCGANIARQVGLIRLRDEISTSFVKCFLASAAGRDALNAHSLGSVQQVINLRDLKTVKVPLPTADLLKRFDQVAAPLQQRADENELQTRTLATLRDALLPRLLSGELRVADAARTAAEVC